LFGIALVVPAFTSDLSTWTVTIHKHGLLTQTISVSQPPNFDRNIAVLRQHVKKEQLESLKQIVVDESLDDFGLFPDMCITDQELTCTMFHLHGKTTTIDAYGLHAVAAFGEPEADKAKARRYCRRWDAIVALTPFTPYRD
jgi:hypothetical protein